MYCTVASTDYCSAQLNGPASTLSWPILHGLRGSSVGLKGPQSVGEGPKSV